MSPNINALYYVESHDIPFTSITDKCIVLDLDQTLIATQDDMISLKKSGILSDPKLMSLRSRMYHIVIDDLNKPGEGSRFECWGITRPHISEFLIFCFSYFKIVAVWSAGTRSYVEAIVEHIFRDIRKPHIIFTRDDIMKGVEKPLVNMINSCDLMKQYMSLDNTLALDDNSSTYIHNPDNALLIPAYEPTSADAMGRDDPTLLQLKYWLLQPEVVNCKDVRTLNKDGIYSNSLESYKNRLGFGYKFK